MRKTIILLLLTVSCSALDLTSHLKQEEGFRSSPYKCSEGFWTVGYGHRCDQNTAPVSKAEAELIIKGDIALAVSQVETLIGKDAPQEAKEIVTAMVFQLGYKGVSKFKQTLKLIRSKDYKGASKEMLNSKWAKQTPARAHSMSIMMSKVR